MTKNINCDFTASTAYPLFLRSYSRTAEDGQKETVLEAKNRAIEGLKDFGSLTHDDLELIIEYFYKNIIFPSGRWFWVGGTEWIKEQKNFIGAYNCASVPVDSWEAFRFNFRALLMGCGVGTIVETHIIEKLPSIKYPINVVEVTELGTNWIEGNHNFDNSSFTAWKVDDDTLEINYTIGDSKEGWVDMATDLLEFSSTYLLDSDIKTWNVDCSHFPKDFKYKKINLRIDASYVRPKGKVLKSFGGLSNPDKLLPGLLDMVKIISGATGRGLNSLECSKLLCIAGVITVVADIRRSALLQEGSPDDTNFTDAKLGLWYQDEDGSWKVDPERDMLRMANLTVSYHVKPDLETTIEAVRKQFYSGEGAILYVPEAVARANADLLDTPKKKQTFIDHYTQSIRKGANYLLELASNMDSREVEHRIRRYGLNPSLRGDTRLLTTEGYKTLEELEGTTFNIINPDGDISESKVWQTGVKETVKLILLQRSTGRVEYIHCTPDHIFLTVDGKEVTAESIHCQEIVAYPKTDEPFRVIDIEPAGVAKVYDFTEPLTNWGVVEGVVTHNCGEIVGNTFFCCLSDVHANLLDPLDIKQQEEAFRASTLTALPLLQHEFDIEELRYSREIDPIIGVCITGLFDFFVNKFGADWLKWWKTGRDKNYINADFYLSTERLCLERWKNIVKDTVVEFCERNGMRVPNRYTAIAPSGSKSLLTGASAGWHPPKATRYIRRITYRVNDPVALACRDYGYNIIPSQDCKDEEGRLLNDPYDPRVTEWLVEIPVEVSWASIGDEADFNPKDCSALAQLDFYMQVHNHYTTHSSSATIELLEDEIEPLGTAIHNLIQEDKGYISAALLAKFEAKETFPRLPFEPISESKYLEEMEAVKSRQKSTDFVTLVNNYSKGLEFVSESGSTGCDSDKCLLPEKR